MENGKSYDTKSGHSGSGLAVQDASRRTVWLKSGKRMVNQSLRGGGSSAKRERPISAERTNQHAPKAYGTAKTTVKLRGWGQNDTRIIRRENGGKSTAVLFSPGGLFYITKSFACADSPNGAELGLDVELIAEGHCGHTTTKRRLVLVAIRSN